MDLINATLINGEYDFCSPIVHVVIKSQYGKQYFYPACQTAKTFCLITGTTTLTRDVLTHIETLGFEVKPVAQKLEQETCLKKFA